jgi:SAM-dependent methyltransferase
MNGNGVQSCRICGERAALVLTGREINTYPLVRCPACGTYMASRRPEPAELAQTYDEMFSGGDYARHRDEFEQLRAGRTLPQPFRSRMLKRVERLSRGRSVVEIGGGSGAFGVLARSRGWSYRGYDVSGVAAGYARELGLDAHVFDGSSVPPLEPASADLVVMWEVIEHVWDVQEYFRVIHQALRPGGQFVCSTPNYLRPAYQRTDDWGVGMAPPVHLNFFTRESLQYALQRSGFASVHVFKRRLFRPSSAAPQALLQSARRLLSLEEPPTIYAVAARS